MHLFRFFMLCFVMCFNKGIAPSLWSKTIINPIPNSASLDKRDPLSCRGISLASSMFKVYCHILKSRLSKWAEANTKVADEQNGFRKRRSTIDQIKSLTNMLDTKEKLQNPLFVLKLISGKRTILLIEIFYGNDYLNWEFMVKVL